MLNASRRPGLLLLWMSLAFLAGCGGGGKGGAGTPGGGGTTISQPVTPVISAPSVLIPGAPGCVATVASQSGCTFAWTVMNGTLTAGQGTTQVTFTAGSSGTLTLTCAVTNPAGTASGQLRVDITAPPMAPVVSAPVLVAAGSTGCVASVPAQEGCTYAWAVTNGTLTAGQGTPQITFTAGTSGTVTLACSMSNPAGTERGQATSSITTLPPTLTGGVATAVLTGNALTGATVDDLLSQTLATIEYQRTGMDPVLVSLFNLNADGSPKQDGTSLTRLSWDPGHDAALFTATFGANVEAIYTNRDLAGRAAPAKAIAVAGTQGPARYLAMGSNPFRTNGLNNANTVNAQMDQFMVNALGWLTGKPGTGSFKVALAQLDDSYWFKDESTTRAWLTATFGAKVSFNAPNAYDGAKLANILTDGADLVVISQSYASTDDPAMICASIKALQDAGKPILYLQRDGGPNALGTLLYALFNLQYAGDNAYTLYLAQDFDGSASLGRLSQGMTDIRETLTHLKTGAFDFTLATAQTTDLGTYQSQFGNGASAVRTAFRALDINRTDLFQKPGQEVPKLLALIGDRIRQDIHYPYTTAASRPVEFLRALFADHAVYTYRKIVPAQKDLGSFSRSDFSQVAPVTRTVTLTSRANFQATGAYALPGKTVTVTRNDSSAVNVSIHVNTLRVGTTYVWTDGSYGGYARPAYLQGPAIPIKGGETISFTSPYGGPIQVDFDAKDLPVSLAMSNVGEHPYWAGREDDTSFTTKMSANQFDWAEIATQGFQVHSKADRLVSGSLANAHWNTPALLAEATRHFTYNFAHVLAGFQGEGIDQEPEIYSWALSHGLPVPTTDVVKHMNADIPLCGWGCSGNPYDAGWAFSPIGHGDIHEMGHSLQSSRWQLNQAGYTYPNHAGTNFYPYYVQSRFYDEVGDPTLDHQSLPFGALYKQLQAAYLAGDREGSVSTSMEGYCRSFLAQGGDGGIGNSYAFFVQFMMQARAKGLLANGWHMMGRIHVVDRAFRAALKDAATWDAQKASFGFGQVGFAEAQALTNTDFMAVAMSFTTGLDIRDYMAMWGFRIGPGASAQIASYQLPAAERVYFAVKDTDWVFGALSNRVNQFQKLRVDGMTTWPY